MLLFVITQKKVGYESSAWVKSLGSIHQTGVTVLVSLGQSFEDCIHLLGNCGQCKLKLVLGADHPRPLISDMLQCSSDVYLFHAFSHAIKNHINQYVSPSPSCTITAVHDDGAGSSSVALIHLPAEVQQGACGGRDALSWPAEEVKLSERPGLLRLHVL